MFLCYFSVEAINDSELRIRDPVPNLQENRIRKKPLQKNRIRIQSRPSRKPGFNIYFLLPKCLSTKIQQKYLIVEVQTLTILRGILDPGPTLLNTGSDKKNRIRIRDSAVNVNKGVLLVERRFIKPQ